MGDESGVVTVTPRQAQLRRLLVLRNAPDSISEWLVALADIPDDVLARAVGHALRTRVYFPMPAELRADADAAALAPVVAPDADRSRALPQPVDVALPIEGREPI